MAVSPTAILAVERQPEARRVKHGVSSQLEGDLVVADGVDEAADVVRRACGQVVHGVSPAAHPERLRGRAIAAVRDAIVVDRPA